MMKTRVSTIAILLWATLISLSGWPDSVIAQSPVDIVNRVNFFCFTDKVVWSELFLLARSSSRPR